VEMSAEERWRTVPHRCDRNPLKPDASFADVSESHRTGRLHGAPPTPRGGGGARSDCLSCRRILYGLGLKPGLAGVWG